MSWLEIWAMLQVIGTIISLIILGIALLFFILDKIIK